MKRNDLVFLAEASKILSSTLDYHVTLASTANLVVNNIADFCIIDVFQPNGVLERVAVKVKNPPYAKLANKMYLYPPDPRNKGAIYDTARSGKPILIKKATQTWLQTVSQLSDEHEVIRKLKLNSHIFVPLKSRGIIIGVLTIASQNPRFSYAASDLLLAEELGIRAGIAVDKARLYSEAQNAIRVRDEFLSLASHELKTPLTSILLQVQLALFNIRKNSGEKYMKEQIESMLISTEKQTKRLGRLINDFLQISLISTGRLQLDTEEVALADIVSDVLEHFKIQIQHSKYNIQTKLEKSAKGEWDRIRIEQVISNLLSNALKYGNNKPINITVSKVGKYAQFIIQDRGIGVEEKQKNEIFEKFKRAVSDKDFKGLGVGLYICKQIVEAHNGTVKIESKKGKGSTFIVALPVSKS